ncbi:Shikimate kinase [Alteripontixanthobacter maritimus]|uniref:Shikimate kinase n=1 Tax=Alteripontixanthobacter maritimus TaxID=2161824 RepID=A0A369Q908_9SPHN|nr:shikimate kinase [Alteripontixanthobacter maritimus]RDC59646.1 Shikimate kinase [Alteripontixanthobacter maritimus]
MRHTTSPTEADDLRAIARRIKRPVVLVGMMGVGKSTIGRRLAGLLQTGFVDADDAIEDAAQLSVAEIFERHGEDYFRDGERRVIARLMDEGSGVVATGGGAFCNEQTRASILQRGIAVWLDCDIETLVERTARKSHRPLLQTGDPREILTRLHAERKQFYEQAPIRVVSDDGPHAETARDILEAIDRWL